MKQQGHSMQILASEPFQLQFKIDHIEENKPYFVNRSFTYTGKQDGFNQQSNNFYNYDQEYSVQHQGVSLRQYNITIIGDKVQLYDRCCRTTTIIFGILLIFPFFLMCCNWWKRKVYPMYQIQVKTYHTIGEMIKKMNGVLLNLRVVDNNFNKQKAGILANHISRSKLTHFNFENMCFRCNYKQNEDLQFEEITKQLKDLHIKTTMNWKPFI